MRKVPSGLVPTFRERYLSLLTAREASDDFRVVDNYADLSFKRVLRAARDDHAALVWTGSFEAGEEVYRRLAKTQKTKPPHDPALSPAELYRAFRDHQRAASTIRHSLLVPLNPDFSLAVECGEEKRKRVEMCLREACKHDDFFKSNTRKRLVSFRDVQEVQSAYDIKQRGIPIKALNDEVIRPNFGVFWPARNEYVNLVNDAPIREELKEHAVLDTGTGTGVLAIVLARRGFRKVIATDIENRAVQCAMENVSSFKLDHTIQVIKADTFPDNSDERFGLTVCNPPWLPGDATSSSEGGVYDLTSYLLARFLEISHSRLVDEGEAWVVMSNFAEILGLRPKDSVEAMADSFGFVVSNRLEAKASHAKALKNSSNVDPLLDFRKQESVYLYILRKRLG